MSNKLKVDVRVRKQRRQLDGSKNFDEVIEFIKTARTLKRQIKLIRGIELENKEEKTIKTVLKDLKEELSLFI